MSEAWVRFDDCEISFSGFDKLGGKRRFNRKTLPVSHCHFQMMGLTCASLLSAKLATIELNLHHTSEQLECLCTSSLVPKYTDSFPAAATSSRQRTDQLSAGDVGQ